MNRSGMRSCQYTTVSFTGKIRSTYEESSELNSSMIESVNEIRESVIRGQHLRSTRGANSPRVGG